MNEKLLKDFEKLKVFMEASQANWLMGKKEAAKQYAREILFYGNRIIEQAEGDEPFISGTYQNMSTAKYSLYLYTDETDPDLLREAVMFAEKALEVKPSNQVALAHGASMYMLLGEIGRASELVEQLTTEGFAAHLRVLSEEMMGHLWSCDLNPVKLAEVPAVLDRLFSFLEMKTADLPMEQAAKDVLTAAFLMNQAQFYNYRLGDTVRAYAILSRSLKDKPEDAAYLSSYRVMCAVCMNPRVDKKQEALKYGELAFRFLEPDKEKKDKADTLSAYGSAMCINGDEAGLEYCREAAELWPGDVTLYNYARSLYDLKKYEEAFPWAKKALYYAEEDMNLLLVADVLRGMKDTEEAVRYYVKAYHKLLNADQLVSFRYMERDGSVMVSLAAPDTLTFFLRYTLKQLVRCYLGMDQQKAKSWLCVAEELFPEDESFDLMKEALEAIDVSREEVQRLKQELTTVKEETEKQRKMSADLVKKLISIQDESQALDLDNAEDWETFSGKIEKIIQSLEAQARNNKKLMQETKERILKKYPFLKDKAVQFLTTAEALYEIHKGTEIDYACIVIEYVKVCEIQLRERLSHILSPNDKMLGNIIYVITNNGVVPYNSHLRELNKINSLRRKSAHTGVLGQQDVEAIKKIYFDDGFLQVLK